MKIKIIAAVLAVGVLSGCGVELTQWQAEVKYDRNPPRWEEKGVYDTLEACADRLESLREDAANRKMGSWISGSYYPPIGFVERLDYRCELVPHPKFKAINH